MTQQNMNNTGFTDKGYLEPQNSSGKLYGNLSYIESKRNLSSAERAVKLGNLDEAKAYLDEFTTLSGLHHAEIQKGFLGSSKVKENLSLIRNLSDSYNVATISRYRDEALRRGQTLDANQFMKLYEKSQQASVNMDAALETSAFLEETLSKMKRSDSVEGITDLSLAKLDEIRINNLYSGNSMENAIAKRIKDLDNSDWTFYSVDRSKDFVGGVLSNITGIADLAGDFYTVITGSKNPIEATETLANLMNLDTSSKMYKAGNFAGFAAFTPMMSAGLAYKSASAGNKLQAAMNVLSSYATKEAAGIHAIHTGLSLAAMKGTGIAVDKILSATKLDENRKKSLPNLLSFAAGIGTSQLMSKYYGSLPNNPNKIPGEGITRGGDNVFPDGDSPSSRVAKRNNQIFEEVIDPKSAEKSLGDVNYGVKRSSFEKSLEINNELAGKLSPKDVASQVETSSSANSAQIVEKARKASTTKGENYEGALLIDNEIYNLTPENVNEGARNASNYNRKIESNGKLASLETSLDTDATVLYNKSTELANTEPSPRAIDIQRDLLIDKGEVSGLEDSMNKVVNYINEVVPTETLARLTEKGSVMISDILKSESSRMMDINPDIAASLSKLANIMETTLAYKSKVISQEGILAKEILKNADAARTQVLLDTAEISTKSVDVQSLKDVSYLEDVTRDGIAELESQIMESFADKYESMDGAVDRYLSENPSEIDLIKKVATTIVEELDRSTKVGADGTSEYYFKSIVDKIAREKKI